ncbi:type II toxin-antitoxin system HipA family toxin [Delftia tsuruhatensis]
MAALGVWMNGERVGTWEVTRTGRHVFAYDPAWPQSAHARPLSLSMPFTRDLTVAGEVVAHYFDNLLPDGEGIRRRIHQRFGLRGIDAFSLLEAIGRDCVGAVQLLPEGAVPDGFDQVRFEPLSEAQIAEHLASLGGGFGALEVDQEFRLSIAGAQEKTAVLRHGGQWCRPLGATPTTHILKPAIGVVPHWHYDLSESVANEWLCARLLAELGFAVADSSIETFGGQQVLCVERFDRAWTAQGWIARLPQEDFCQVRGVASANKYETHGGPGMLQCLQVLQHGSEPAQDCARFVMAQLAFWLLGATDGHAKNFSVFLQPGGGYEMTPLYDVLSAWPIIGHGHGKIARQRARMAMALPGRSRHYRLAEIQRRHWKALADTTRIAGLWESMVEMVEALDGAIARLQPRLPASVPQPMARQIFDGARDQARRFLAGSDH